MDAARCVRAEQSILCSFLAAMEAEAQARLNNEGGSASVVD